VGEATGRGPFDSTTTRSPLLLSEIDLLSSLGNHIFWILLSRFVNLLFFLSSTKISSGKKLVWVREC
jgi:hypothetical protein